MRCWPIISDFGIANDRPSGEVDAGTLHYYLEPLSMFVYVYIGFIFAIHIQSRAMLPQNRNWRVAVLVSIRRRDPTMRFDDLTTELLPPIIPTKMSTTFSMVAATFTSPAAGPPSPPSCPDWATSKERKILAKDIAEGAVPPTMWPREVREMHGGIYKQWPASDFRGCLRTLRKSVGKDQERALSDNQAFVQYRLNHPVVAANDGSRKYPRWNGSDAERMLKEDIESGALVSMRPRELRLSRSEYQKWPLQVFRGHIHQEIRSKVETPYWMAKRAKKAEKKAARAAKKAARRNAGRN